MRKLASVLVLSAVVMPAFAGPTFQVPEPETFSLLAIGALAFFMANRNAK
ncbi:MAG: PEP-CTERM sorting domain-containing protein [Methylomonas sp.]|nr:PEP-CTERM sorting domain-containing protein [Methylomonas sp.]